MSAALKVPKNTMSSIILKLRFGTNKSLPGRSAKLSNRGEKSHGQGVGDGRTFQKDNLLQHSTNQASMV
jgi:hypothetical protein